MNKLTVQCTCGEEVEVTSSMAASVLGKASRPPSDPAVRKARAQKAIRARWDKRDQSK